MLFLAEPSVIYRDSFIQSVHEFQAEGRQLHSDLKSITSDFGAFVHGVARSEGSSQAETWKSTGI